MYIYIYVYIYVYIYIYICIHKNLHVYIISSYTISTQVKPGGELRNNPPACAPSTSLSPVLVGEWGICRVEITGTISRVYTHVYIYVYIYKYMYAYIYVYLSFYLSTYLSV